MSVRWLGLVFGVGALASLFVACGDAARPRSAREAMCSAGAAEEHAVGEVVPVSVCGHEVKAEKTASGYWTRELPHATFPCLTALGLAVRDQLAMGGTCTRERALRGASSMDAGAPLGR